MSDKVVWIPQGWQPVSIGFCPSQKAWEAEQRRLKLSAKYPAVAGMGGHTQIFENNVTFETIILVTVASGSERDAMEVILTIVHEAVHVFQFICKAIGEHNPGMEMEAYSIENITAGLFEAYCTTQGKNKVWS